MRSYRLHRVFLALMLLTDAAVVSGACLPGWRVRFGSGRRAFKGLARPFRPYGPPGPVPVDASG